MTSVDDRKDKPFHCDNCGDTYEPCHHWDADDLIVLTPVKGYYYKDRPEGVQLISGMPLPKDPDGKVRNYHFIDCTFHPNCKPDIFIDCQFTNCDGPSNS